MMQCCFLQYQFLLMLVKHKDQNIFLTSSVFSCLSATPSTDDHTPGIQSLLMYTQTTNTASVIAHYTYTPEYLNEDRTTAFISKWLKYHWCKIGNATLCYWCRTRNITIVYRINYPSIYSGVNVEHWDSGPWYECLMIHKPEFCDCKLYFIEHWLWMNNPAASLYFFWLHSTTRDLPSEFPCKADVAVSQKYVF